jgi:hypothetical protein
MHRPSHHHHRRVLAVAPAIALAGCFLLIPQACNHEPRVEMEGGTVSPTVQAQIQQNVVLIEKLAPLVRPSEVGAELTLTGHAHAFLGLGDAGAKDAEGVESLLTKLLSSAASWTARAPWLVGADANVARIASLRPEIMGANGEMHIGQFMLYLQQVGVDLRSREVMIGGKPVTLQALLSRQVADAVPWGENDWLIPAAVLSMRDGETYPSRDREEVRELLRGHLQSDPSTRPCGGLHWWSALVVVRNFGGSAFGPEVVNEVASRLEGHREAVLASIGVDGGVSSQTPGDETYMLVLQGHTAEFLMMAAARDNSWKDERLHRIMRRLIVMCGSEITDQTPLGPRAHAAHALRLYIEMARERGLR